MSLQAKQHIYSLTVAILSLLMTSAPSMSLLKLYSHDTVHHFLTHLWFLQVLTFDHFAFWYSAPIASFPTSTLQLGQWFHSPYIYILSLFDVSYNYFDLRFEFLFWRTLSFLGFYLFSGHYLLSPTLRVTSASMYIASGMVASTDPEILFLQAFAFIPWILFSFNTLFDHPFRASALIALSVSSIIWFGYHGIALVLPVFCITPVIFFLFSSTTFKSITKRLFILILSSIFIITIIGLKISDTLTVPLFGSQLGPSRSSFEGLLLPSQLLSIFLPNPTFFYSPEEPVSLQGLYIGFIPFLILLFVLDYCIEWISNKIYSDFNCSPRSTNIIDLFSVIILVFGFFKISYILLLCYILLCRFSHYCKINDKQSRTRTKSKMLLNEFKYSHIRSVLHSFTFPQGSLLCNTFLALLTGVASPIVGLVQNLYPPMQLVRYQSNNLIFLVIGFIILSLSFLEYFAKNFNQFIGKFKFRERLVFLLQFVSIIALWMLLHINEFYDYYYQKRIIVTSSIVSYCLLSVLGVLFTMSILYFLKHNVFYKISTLIVFLFTCLLFSLVSIASGSQIFLVPSLFRYFTDLGFFSFIINFIHFIITFCFVLLIYYYVRLNQQSINMWCLLCVIDVSTASTLYVFQSTIIIGDHDNVPAALSDIFTPQARVGPENISVTYYPQSLRPGMWTFSDVMPSSITYMKSHTLVGRNLVTGFPRSCGSLISTSQNLFYTITDISISSYCYNLFDSNLDISIQPTIEKWVGSTIVVNVHANEPSYLVFFDGWAPGWTATVDGNETPVLRVDSAVRAIRIPAGYSRVQSNYYPVGYFIIFPLTLLCIILCIIVVTNAIIVRIVNLPLPLWLGIKSLPIMHPQDSTEDSPR